MKKIAISSVLLLLAGINNFAQVLISTEPAGTPDNSAMLEVRSTNSGLLPPRMTMAEIGEIANPANGLMVYCTTDCKFYAYNACTNAWKEMSFGTGTITPACGTPITINHVTGVVAPVTKTVIYGTVKNIPGEPSKCWITRNLGANQQATAVTENTEASAGWYWQFNRKQGYQYLSDRIPNTTWITSISEDLAWLSVNDPCKSELGSLWRIPTLTEWFNVDNAGIWTTWSMPFASGLKLHAAGYLSHDNGYLYGRGAYGMYWSANQYDLPDQGWDLTFGSNWCGTTHHYKADAYSIRCLRDDCDAAPSSPTTGTHTPSATQIVWNWNPVTDATGYRWNTIPLYTTATDIGLTSKTETGLICNTAYTRYVWAYNACGYSAATILTQTTLPCPCGQTITVNHVAGSVAPVNKTVTYGTVTNIPGETAKCWITSNLGADHQATAYTDTTEASAGWYWQFNREQGYKNGGTVTPSWTITSINDDFNWMFGHDPCRLVLGTVWRIPTFTEWTNVSANWSGSINAWNSDLKLHLAGYLSHVDGSLHRTFGHYWSSTQYQFDFQQGYSLWLGTDGSGVLGTFFKAEGYPIRCIRD